jgi:hypothetical protein
VSPNQSDQQPNGQPNTPSESPRLAGRWVFDLVDGGNLYLASRIDDNQVVLDVHEALELLDYLYQHKDELLKIANELGNDESEWPEWIDEVL